MSALNEGFLRRAHRVRHTLKRKAHIYAQVIDDSAGRTVVAASTLDKDLRGALKKGSDLEAAQAVGKLVAERALKAGVTNVVFDRGGYIYHGRVKALADAAREAGLNF